ncbi:hypothetical protein LXL04_004102, partial [Taraxacum kok-saghyz]
MITTVNPREGDASGERESVGRSRHERSRGGCRRRTPPSSAQQRTTRAGQRATDSDVEDGFEDDENENEGNDFMTLDDPDVQDEDIEEMLYENNEDDIQGDNEDDIDDTDDELVEEQIEELSIT